MTNTLLPTNLLPLSPQQERLAAAIASSADLLVQAREVLKELKAEAENLGRTAGPFSDIGTEFEAIEKRLAKINCQQISDRTAASLNRHLHKRISTWVSKYLSKIVRSGAGDAHQSLLLEHRRGQIRDSLDRVLAKQVTDKMQQRLTATGFSTQTLPAPKAKKAIAAPPPGVATRAQFPRHTFTTHNLEASWSKLRKQWEHAYKVATQVEDLFRLEQIATSQLPESLRMFQLLGPAAEYEQAEAAELLREQFTIMRKQVEQIAQKHSVDALTALRAQTAAVRSIAQHEEHLALPGRL